MADEQLALANPDGRDEKDVYDDDLANAELAHGKSVDGAQGDDYEQIGHLPDCNLLGAVTYDAEYCKESQCNSCLELDVAEHVDEHEGAYGNENVCEEELATFALGVVESAHDDEYGNKVDEECQQQFLYMYHVDECIALAFLLY